MKFLGVETRFLFVYTSIHQWASLTNPNSELVSRVFPVAMGTADEHLWAPNPKSKRQHIQDRTIANAHFHGHISDILGTKHLLSVKIRGTGLVDHLSSFTKPLYESTNQWEKDNYAWSTIHWMANSTRIFLDVFLRRDPGRNSPARPGHSWKLRPFTTWFCRWLILWVAKSHQPPG